MTGPLNPATEHLPALIAVPARSLAGLRMSPTRSAAILRMQATVAHSTSCSAEIDAMHSCLQVSAEPLIPGALA